MGSFVNAAIPFGVGVFCLLIGFRLVGKKPGADPKLDEWHARFGTVFKVCGPVLMAVGVLYLVLDISRR